MIPVHLCCVYSISYSIQCFIFVPWREGKRYSTGALWVSSLYTSSALCLSVWRMCVGPAFAMLLGSNCAHKDSTTCNYLHGWEQLMVPISKNGINKAYLKMILYGEFTQKRNCLLHHLLTLISFRINFFLLYTTKGKGRTFI